MHLNVHVYWPKMFDFHCGIFCKCFSLWAFSLYIVLMHAWGAPAELELR